MEVSKPNYEAMYKEAEKYISQLEVRLKDSEETRKRILDQNDVLQRALADASGEIRGLKFAIEQFAKGV